MLIDSKEQSLLLGVTLAHPHVRVVQLAVNVPPLPAGFYYGHFELVSVPLLRVVIHHYLRAVSLSKCQAELLCSMNPASAVGVLEV